MAAPHVSGVAALMKAVHPNLSSAEFISSLQNGQLSTDIGSSGRDNSFGYGLIDALKSVQQAQLLAGGSATGSLLASPNRIDFGSTSNSRELSLEGIGSNPPAIVSVSESLPWLTITDLGGDNYQLTVNRSGFGDATYSGNIEFSLDNATELNIPVAMTVQTSGTISSDAGFLYVLLLDADNYDFVAQLNVDVSDGEYEYNFNNIPYGEYVVVAGSDIDNDSFICGVGESCGSYPTNDQPLRILVDGSKESLNFLASLVSNVVSNASNTDESENRPLAFQRKVQVQPINSKKF